MSRLGKHPIAIPEKVEVTRAGLVVTVKGPKGELSRSFRDEVSIEIADGQITTAIATNDVFCRKLWGTYA